MIGLTGLPRTGQVPQAIDFILEHDKTFEYSQEDYKAACEKVHNTYYLSTEYDELAKDKHNIEDAVDKWLTERYFLFEIDYTDSEDIGSREEVVLLFEKKDGLYGEVPDFTKVVAQFYR